EAGRRDISAIDTTQPGFHQEALVPLDSESHAGEDVSLHAMGPGSAYVQGVMEQNAVFHVINKALGLEVMAK
ncbi:MAG TPA: alkaline phosphatase, partial [Psychrobacter sp.]|nr:alkaline phosphatase [Psychrobacter sp.]